jgi:hypothetical protein
MSSTTQNAGDAASVTLTVLNAADNSTGIPGVKIAVIGYDGGEEAVAETDAWGQVDLPAAILGRSRLVTVCHPLFYCGALRKEDLAGLQKRTIAIAPLVLR